MQAIRRFPKWRCIGNVLLNDEPAEKCNGMINRSHTQQENYGFSGQFTVLADLAGARHAVTAGAAFDASHATFRQTSQFGYLNPDRSITPVAFFADGTEIDDDGTPVDNRVDLSGRMRTWSVYASDSIALNQDLTLDRFRPLQPQHGAQPRRHHARRRQRFARWRPPFQPLQSRHRPGLCAGRRRRAPTSVTTKAAARRRPSNSVAPTRKTRAACPTPWPATRH